MKRLFTLLLALGTLSMAHAQLANGSVAPDFTATDIDGVEHNLYDYLDEGKTVILDISATWCPPCWSYVQAGALETVYEEHGPDGLDDIVVLFIEGDGSTGMADLQGQTSATMGNWIEAVNYPIIDDASIASLYQIGYYPTMYAICPNRLVTEIGQVNAATHIAFAEECPVAEGAVNAGIIGYNGLAGAFCTGESFIPSVKFQNLGSDMLTSASFELVSEGEVIETVDFTGELATYDFADIEFSSYEVVATTDLSIQISSVNGGDDEFTDNDVFTASLVLAPEVPTEVINIVIETDDYGYETYWDIQDEAGNIVASGGNENVGNNGGGQQSASPNNPGAYANNVIIEETVELPANGCYTIRVLDDYGDGMCCAWGTGNFAASDEDGVVLYTVAEFESRASGQVQANSIVNVPTVSAVEQITLAPNPADAQTNVMLTLTESKQLQLNVVNSLGQQVRSLGTQQFAAGQHSLNIQTSDLTPGIYLLHVQDEQGVVTRKFTVQH